MHDSTDIHNVTTNQPKLAPNVDLTRVSHKIAM